MISRTGVLALLTLFLYVAPTMSDEDDHDHGPVQGKEHKHDSKEAAQSNKQAGKHDDHDEGHGEEGEEGHDHGSEKGHAHEGGGHEDHGEEKAPKNVGPTKGITSFDEHEGFTISKEAFANFKIESMKLQGQGPWSVPKSALIKTRDEVAVFRMRDGKYLRVSVSVTGKAPNQQIKGKDLKTGDEIVSKGGGFLRVAEIDVTSGEVGHHH